MGGSEKKRVNLMAHRAPCAILLWLKMTPSNSIDCRPKAELLFLVLLGCFVHWCGSVIDIDTDCL